MNNAERRLKNSKDNCDLISQKEYYSSMKRCVKNLKVYYEYHTKAKAYYNNVLEELKKVYPGMFDKRSGLPKKAYKKFIEDRLPKLYFLQTRSILPYTSDLIAESE